MWNYGIVYLFRWKLVTLSHSVCCSVCIYFVVTFHLSLFLSLTPPGQYAIRATYFGQKHVCALLSASQHCAFAVCGSVSVSVILCLCILQQTTTVWMLAAVLLVYYGSPDFRFDSCFIIYLFTKKHTMRHRLWCVCVCLRALRLFLCVYCPNTGTRYNTTQHNTYTYMFTSFIQTIKN